VLELSPSPSLTANEIAAAQIAIQGRTFNPQEQYPVSWPDAPVVARAYLDQLLREGGVGKEAAASLAAALDKAEVLLDAGRKDARVAALLRTEAGHLAGAAADSRQVKLARVIEAIAAKLR
jgi:hypothetical protein